MSLFNYYAEHYTNSDKFQAKNIDSDDNNNNDNKCDQNIKLTGKHQIDWDSATCITYSTDYYQRLTLESWFTNLEQMPLNRSQQLPAPYNDLLTRSSKTNYERTTEELTI